MVDYSTILRLTIWQKWLYEKVAGEWEIARYLFNTPTQEEN